LACEARYFAKLQFHPMITGSPNGWVSVPFRRPPAAVHRSSVIVLALISRAYTVRLQDRIVRLEMQLRLGRLGREHDFRRLSTAQLAALRFASNAELPGLLDRSLAEDLTPDQIKRAVCDWQPDFYRT